MKLLPVVSAVLAFSLLLAGIHASTADEVDSYGIPDVTGKH